MKLERINLIVGSRSSEEVWRIESRLIGMAYIGVFITEWCFDTRKCQIQASSCGSTVKIELFDAIDTCKEVKMLLDFIDDLLLCVYNGLDLPNKPHVFVFCKLSEYIDKAELSELLEKTRIPFKIIN